MTQEKISKASQQLVCDLVDGRLRGEAFERAVALVASDRSSADAWHVYHLIGDTLRSSELAGHCLDTKFVDTVQSRLGSELWTDASGANRGVQDQGAPVSQFARRPTAANHWSWSMVVGLASLVAALIVAWTLGGEWAVREPAAQLSQARPAPQQPAAELARAGPPIMIRDARLDELLAAHKQLGGTSALQKPAGFLRNAVFEEGTR